MLGGTACDMTGGEDGGPEPEQNEPEDGGVNEPEGGPDDAGPNEPEDAGPNEPEGDAGPGDTIYDRLGGHDGIESAIGDFIVRVLEDPAINIYFHNGDLDATRLTACLVHQVAVATGGPGDPYPTGDDTLEVDDLNGGTVTCRSMEASHAGLGISTQDNDDLVGHLVAELSERGVATADIEAIGAVLGGLTGIVEAPNNNETLYQRLGRAPGITAVVGNFIGRVVADPSINAYFMNNTLDAARLSTCLVRQVAQNGVSGGPAQYGNPNAFVADVDNNENGTIEAGEECQDMVTVHTGLGISKAEHYALVDHFIAAAVDENTNNADVNLGAGDGEAVQGVLDGLVDDVVEEDDDCATGRDDADDDCNVNTLYHRLGGTPGIGAVVGNAFGRILGDSTTNAYFLNADYVQSKVDRTASCLVRQFCAASGGPCLYDAANAFDAAIDTDGNGTVESGEQCRDMLSSHAGLNIADYEQEAFKGHVVDAVVELVPGIATPDATALIGVLDSTDDAVVEADDFGVPGNATNLYHRIGGKDSLVAFLKGVPDATPPIEGFTSRVVTDFEIGGFFINTVASPAATARLETCLTRQLCEATGGPCEYLTAGPLVALTGNDTDNGIVDTQGTPDLTDDIISNCLTMAVSHPASMTNPPGGAGARIQAADFNDLVGHAADTLDALGVDPLDRDVIAGALAPICSDIVEDTGNCQ